MLVDEAMYYSIRLIEAWRNDVEVLSVACVITPENGIGDVVRDLD